MSISKLFIVFMQMALLIAVFPRRPSSSTLLTKASKSPTGFYGPYRTMDRYRRLTTNVTSNIFQWKTLSKFCVMRRNLGRRVIIKSWSSYPHTALCFNRLCVSLINRGRKCGEWFNHELLKEIITPRCFVILQVTSTPQDWSYSKRCLESKFGKVKKITDSLFMKSYSWQTVKSIPTLPKQLFNSLA